MSTEFLTATEALDRFFDVIREEAELDVHFEHKLVSALGANIKYRGSDAARLVDPVMIAMKGLEEFRATFLSFELKKLRDIALNFDVATPTDVSGVGRGRAAVCRLVDIMWEGANNKLNDIRGSVQS